MHFHLVHPAGFALLDEGVSKLMETLSRHCIDAGPHLACMHEPGVYRMLHWVHRIGAVQAYREQCKGWGGGVGNGMGWDLYRAVVSKVRDGVREGGVGEGTGWELCRPVVSKVRAGVGVRGGELYRNSCLMHDACS